MTSPASSLDEVSPLKEKRIKVTVRTLKGMSFKLALKPSATIYSVKEKIAGTSDGTEPDLQILMHGTNILDNNSTIASYHIRNGTILDMEPPTVSIMLVGSKGVGKTSIQGAFMNPMAKLPVRENHGRSLYDPEVQTHDITHCLAS